MSTSEIKTCVPWFSLSEWKQVYEDVYSRDSQCQKRGYERLLLWKARVGRLPAGVECTVGFMQVCFQDKRISKEILTGQQPLYAENDLRLVFATAVMRFFNFIATLAQGDDTLYSMAEKLNIPEWLVVLRHDAAHRNDLPSLAILRIAVQFGLEWLNEHYWKESRQTLSDWVMKDVPSNDKSIGELMDIWQGLKMYELDGYIHVDELRDRKLREYLSELQSARNKVESSKWYTNRNSRFKRKCVQLPSGSDLLNDDNEEDENMENEEIEDRYKLKDAIHAVRITVVEVIAGKKRLDKRGAVDKFVTQLVNSEGFIPSEYFTIEMCEKVGEKLNRRELPEWIRTFWKDLLVLLQQHHSMFPHIVHKLLQLFTKEKDDHRQFLMALWIKELCLSMIKWKKTESLMSAKKLKSGKQLKNMCYALAKVEKRFPHLTKIMLSVCNDEAGTSCSIADVKFAVSNPHKYTLLFIESLLDVASPPISDSAKDQLMSLATIYNNGKYSSVIVEENHIFTIEDIEASEGNDMDESETHDLDLEESSENVSPPTASFSSLVMEYDWSKCPMGVLPWQQDTLPIFDIPSEIIWTRSQLEIEDEREKRFQHILQEDIDWRRVQKDQLAIKKRRREKKKISEMKMKFRKLQSTSF